MESIDFLTQLSQSGHDAGWFETKTLGLLDKSCCPQVKTEVIDFDQTKTLLAQYQKKALLKSCDALKILNNADQQRLDFIEMKGWLTFYALPFI